MRNIDNLNKRRRERYQERKRYLFDLHKNKCKHCGVTLNEKNLILDHIDPSLKTFDFGRRLGDVSLQRMMKEFENSQLLCRRCHYYKTLEDHGVLWPYSKELDLEEDYENYDYVF